MDARDKRGHDAVNLKRHMAETDPLDTFIDAAARLLALPLDPAWKPAVKANLTVIFEHAARVAEFELPDETEPAPTYTP